VPAVKGILTVLALSLAGVGACECWHFV